MTRHNSRAILGAGAILAASALVLTGCGGSGFDEPGSSSDGLTSSKDPLTILIGSSGEAETAAVEDAVGRHVDERGTGRAGTLGDEVGEAGVDRVGEVGVVASGSLLDRRPRASRPPSRSQTTFLSSSRRDSPRDRRPTCSTWHPRQSRATRRTARCRPTAMN